MKKPIKLTTFFTAHLLAALFVIMLLPGITACNQQQASTTKHVPIDISVIKSHLVPLDKAISQEKNFVPSPDTAPKKPLYTGGILRNSDVLLSLGLNNDSLYSYVQCLGIRLKTMLGVNDANEVTLYVHPVLIENNQTGDDLYFDSVGNLYKYDPAKKIGTPFIPNSSCTYNGMGAAMPGSKVQETLPASSLYVIDLNNPCPPCL